jgi:hypothetical protein
MGTDALLCVAGSISRISLWVGSVTVQREFMIGTPGPAELYPSRKSHAPSSFRPIVSAPC